MGMKRRRRRRKTNGCTLSRRRTTSRHTHRRRKTNSRRTPRRTTIGRMPQTRKIRTQTPMGKAMRRMIWHMPIFWPERIFFVWADGC